MRTCRYGYRYEYNYIGTDINLDIDINTNIHTSGSRFLCVDATGIVNDTHTSVDACLTCTGTAVWICRF